MPIHAPRRANKARRTTVNLQLFRTSGPIVLVAVFQSVWLGPAVAQQPTADQTAAIRQSCRSDFMANCSSVQPGGKEALECLQRNLGKLSAACKTAVDAIGEAAKPPTPPAPAAAAAPTPPSNPLPPAEPAAPPPHPAKAETPPPAAPPPPAAAAAKQPTPQQTSAVRSACRSDFMAHCSGVQPGGADALKCLERNSAQLSPACRSAVAAIAVAHPPAGGPPPVAPGYATPPPVVAPVVVPLVPMPFVSPREALFILRICTADQQMLCPGVPAGGGRILTCLAEQAPRLTPGCYAALAAARR
jgi:Cysteine rich repeat